MNKRSLTQKQALEVRRRWRAGESQTEIAKELGVSRSVIYGITSGRYYTPEPCKIPFVPGYGRCDQTD